MAGGWEHLSPVLASLYLLSNYVLLNVVFLNLDKREDP